MRTKGWQSILRFTLVEYIKTKSFIISTTVICVLVAAVCVLSNLLPTLIGGDDVIDDITSGIGEGGGSIADLSDVYFRDDAGILTAEDVAALEKAGAILTATDQSYDELKAALEDAAETEQQAALMISATNGSGGEIAGYDISVIYSAGGKDGAELLSDLAWELVNRRNMLNLGVAAEDYAKTQLPVSVSVMEAGKERWDEFTGVINYIVPITVSMVLFLLIFSYGSIVAQSIATEKTSRVMELLLTSVRPLAIVIGKVLAMAIVSLGQFLLIALVGGLSFAISAPFGFAGKVQEIMSSPEFIEFAEQAAAGTSPNVPTGIDLEDAQLAQAVGNFMSSFSPFNIILIVVIFLLGFVLFSLFAALVGASISRIEDLNAAMQPYSLSGILGVYLAYFPVIFNADSLETGIAATNPVQIFSYYFPLSAPFALPSAILLGTLSKAQCVIATLVLAAAVVLVAILVSKVYEAIILHNGNRIKLKDMIKMAVRK